MGRRVTPTGHASGMAASLRGIHQQAATADGEATGPDRIKQHTAHRTIKYIVSVHHESQGGSFPVRRDPCYDNEGRGTHFVSLWSRAPLTFAVGGAKVCRRL